MSRESLTSCVESNSKSDQSVVSLLQQLHSPTPSDLARKRKVTATLPIKAKQGKIGSPITSLNNISVADHVESYPDESFILSNKKKHCVKHAMKKLH